jgi:hypothetical protein
MPYPLPYKTIILNYFHNHNYNYNSTDKQSFFKHSIHDFMTFLGYFSRHTFLPRKTGAAKQKEGAPPAV